MQSQSKQLFTRFIKGVGNVLSLAGLGYVGWILWSQRFVSNQMGLRLYLLSVGCGAAIFFLASLLLAKAWILFLPCSGTSLHFRKLFSHYSTTQIGKYLPGNVFHFFGRQSCATWPGLTQKQVAFASLAENVLLIGVAAIFPAVAWVFGLTSTVLPQAGFPALIAGVGALTVVVLLLFSKYGPDSLGNLRESLWNFLPKACMGMCLYMIYFATAGLAFILVGNLLLGPGWNEMALVEKFWIFPVVWIAGFVTPGAPGGIGVRESLIVLALEPSVDAASAAQFAMVFRLATVSGDLLTFLLGRCLRVPIAT